MPASRIADVPRQARPSRPCCRRAFARRPRRDRCRVRGERRRHCGSCAIAASNFAVAGIEPVEPAAITGWFEPARRFISASMRRSRRRAASIMPFSVRSSGQELRAILRKSSVSCQYLSNWSGTRPSSFFQSISRVMASSIRRARSSARASTAAGVLAISGAPFSGRIAAAQRATSCASNNRRSIGLDCWCQS